MEEMQVQDSQEQAVNNVTADTSVWVKPGFEIIGVSLECTAYAGTLEE
jgi:hypothetical protein